MKVLEQVRASGSAAPLCIAASKRAAWEKYAAQYRGLAATSGLPVLDANRQARFYYAESDQEYWNLNTDFGPLFAPHQMFWAEHALPNVIRSRVKGSMFSNLDAHTGVLVIGIPISQATVTGAPPETAHILALDPCFDYGFGAGAVGPYGPWIFALDVSGRVLDRPWLNTFADAEHEEYMISILAGLNPVLFAIGEYNNGKPLDWIVP